MKKLVFILGVASIVASCGKHTITIQAIRPAEIMVPEHLNRLGVANRSVAGKGQKFNNFVEGLVTGEGIGDDRKASGVCVESMVEKSNKDGMRIEAVFVADERLTGTGRDQMEAPIRWSLVDSLCETYNLDGIILLESFDSDMSQRTYNPVPKSKTVNGQRISYTESTLEVNLYIHAGWRIYDAKNRVIIDQKIYRDGKNYKGTETSDGNRTGVPSQRKALQKVAAYAGERYAGRLSPLPMTLTRNYFTKAKKVDQFKLAHKKAKANDWQGAIEIWKRYVDHANQEVRLRACVNMAVAAEVLGNLDMAIEYAEKSQAAGHKYAADYINALHQRKIDEQRVSEQLYENQP